MKINTHKGIYICNKIDKNDKYPEYCQESRTNNVYYLDTSNKIYGESRIRVCKNN